MTTTLKLAPGMKEVLIEEARLAPLGHDATAEFWSVGATEMYSVKEFSYPGAENQPQRLRLYRATADTRPTLVYIHGGGWIEGSIDYNDSAARALAKQSGRHVVSLSYRLAPAHPYPAALSDCIAAVRWLLSGNANADLTQHLDLNHLAIGGASAGANLALTTALSLPLSTFDALVLFYGLYSDDMTRLSYTQHQNGPGLTRDRVEMIFDLYDPQHQRKNDLMVTPLFADLKGLPPTIVAAAEIDVLRSENELFAERLQDAGVEVSAWIEPGVTHGFINRGRLLPGAKASLLKAAEVLSAIKY